MEGLTRDQVIKGLERALAEGICEPFTPKQVQDRIDELKAQPNWTLDTR
jgi:hypothetical protein